MDEKRAEDERPERDEERRSDQGKRLDRTLVILTIVVQVAALAGELRGLFP